MSFGKHKAATTAQVIRFHHIYDLGCIACRLQGVGWVAPGQDHRNNCDLAGMKRTDGGHDDTLGLCDWHHQGYPPSGWSMKRAEAELGPSKHLHKKRFLATYGSIQELHDMQEILLGKMLEVIGET